MLLHAFRAALILIVFGLATSTAKAQTIFLEEFRVNIDGSTSQIGVDPLPTGADVSGLDLISGLGTFSVMVAGAGNHHVSIFVDHEIDEGQSSFFNEVGSSTGTPGSGQTWEIDEPGFGSPALGSGGVPYLGDIFGNFSDSNDVDGSFLDNSVFFDFFDDQTLSVPDDVSMAMGWDFLLGADEKATINFLIGLDQPTGFYLTHFDTDSNDEFYLSSSLSITTPGIPEPSSILLLGGGLVAFGAATRRRRQQRAS